MLPSSHRVVVFFALGIAFTLAGCAKKTIVSKTVPAPPPPTPSASLAASPNELQAGRPATLTWNTQNASQVSISGVGTVAARGSTIIRPQTSTTYVLAATGPGGSKEASARVTVTQPPPAVTAKATATDEELFSANIKDVFFAYDTSNVAANEEAAVQQDARFLIAHPYMKLMISGHCDERGSEEYNLTLGDGRAGTVAAQLERLGVQADRIRTISYGKENPFCTEETESCWQLNRRAHFLLQP
jgi:peptidoglycan-associated lipoprotein